jgi:hypothetical protein
MISMVGSGELDCVIGPAVSQVPGVRMTRLAGEPLHLVCRADHRLAEQAEVSIRQLADERFVEVPAGWTARLLSDAAFAGEGIPRRVVCEVGDWELFLELVSSGVGIGFAPASLRYPVLTAPDSVLRLIAVEGARLERQRRRGCTGLKRSCPDCQPARDCQAAHPTPRSAPDDIRTGWHFTFFSLPNIPELLLAGRERPFWTYYARRQMWDPSALAEEDIDEIVHSAEQPGGTRAILELYRARQTDAGRYELLRLPPT